MKEQKHIFLIDDNELFAATVCNGLKEKLGARVSVFYTGEAMLEKLSENPDVIILDFQLDSHDKNAKDGGEILKEIMIKAPSQNVIMLTSMEDLKNAVSLLKKGAVDYILKDEVFFDNLLNSVKNVFEIRDLRNEIAELKYKSRQYRKRVIIVFAALIAVVAILGILLL
ncbi:MAG: response regulator [Bacteroidetes bacterium]|nr:response regulator [Bacteroidota bacterium]